VADRLSVWQMKAAPAFPLRKRLGRFARWFFNVSPTLALDDEPEQRLAERRAAAARLAARAQGRSKPRRRHQQPVSTTRAVRER